MNEIDGEPLVCKIYFKREMNEAESKLYAKHVNSLLEIRELYNIKNSPNVAPILLVKDNLLVNRYIYFMTIESRNDNTAILFIQFERKNGINALSYHYRKKMDKFSDSSRIITSTFI